MISGKSVLILILLGLLHFVSVMNTHAHAEGVSLFHDVVDVAAGIQYLAALKSDGTVSLAKIRYSFEPGSEEAYVADFKNNDCCIPVDMDVLQSEVSEWINIETIGIFIFSDDTGFEKCELLIGLDNNGKLHIARGLPPTISDDDRKHIISRTQVEDWSDVISFSTCGGLLVGVLADGSLYLTGCFEPADEVEFLVENASDAASVKMAWSAQGLNVGCLFQDGRLGTGHYDIEKGEYYIDYIAGNVVDFDVGQSGIAALHVDGTVSWWGRYIPNCPDIKQACCFGLDTLIVKQDGTVSRVGPVYSDEITNEIELCDTDLDNMKQLYTNHSGNIMYGILGLKNDGSVIVTEWNEHMQPIDLSEWTEITDIAFPEENILYVAGLRQDGSIIISDNVTAEMY